MRIAKEIQASPLSEQERMKEFKNTYDDFFTKYPNLFEMCCKPNCNMQMLEYMMEMLEKVHGNDTSQDDASVKVGQMLFDTYVNPVLPAKK